MCCLAHTLVVRMLYSGISFFCYIFLKIFLAKFIKLSDIFLHLNSPEYFVFLL